MLKIINKDNNLRSDASFNVYRGGNPKSAMSVNSFIETAYLTV